MLDAVQMSIRQFAFSKPAWSTARAHYSEVSGDLLEKVLSWKPDGTIILAKPYRVEPLLQIQDIPMVVVDLYHQRPEHLSTIETDERAIGELAASYFLGNQFEHFAMVTRPDTPTYSPL